MPFVVQKNNRFYTGNHRKSSNGYDPLWSNFVQHAKKYQKRGWANKAAQKSNAAVVELQNK